MKKGGWILIVVAIVLASCKKKEIIKTETTILEVEPEPSVIGVWEGYYGNRLISGTDTTFYEPNYGYSMVFKPNGEALVYSSLLADTSENYRATGTWIYATNHTISVSYTYEVSGISFSARASIDPKMHAINGKWYNADGSTGGLFFLVKT
jgi:hypothetical protein